MTFLLIVGGLFSPVWVPIAMILHRLENTPKEKRWQFSLLWLLLLVTAEGIALVVAIQSYRIIQAVASSSEEPWTKLVKFCGPQRRFV